MTLSRRHLLWGTAALTVASCKRNKEAVVPEVWDEAPVPERAEALGKLAPPWPAPARGTLDSGLLTYWLHDPGATQAHVRLMLPDHDGDPLPALVVRSIVGTLRKQVRRGMGRVGARVSQARRAGRVELALSGPADALPRMASALALSLSRGPKANRGLGPALLQARARAARDGEARTTVDVATATTISALLGTSLDSQRIDPSRAESYDTEVLLDAWSRLLDPRRCALVIHTAQAPDDLPRLLAGFDRWTGVGRRDAPDSSLARLRWTPKDVGDLGHLMTDGGTALLLPTEKAAGTAHLVMGCRLDTATVTERANARLAQRLIGESQDARLALAGPTAVFTIGTAVSDKSIESRAQSLVESLSAMGRNRSPSQRLFTAAQLWLGARVVQASLDGEDWTALWSESMDLANAEADIPRALAADAAAMLAIEPDPLAAWIAERLDPRLGKAGWAWALAGATDKMQRALSRMTETRPVAPTA